MESILQNAYERLLGLVRQHIPATRLEFRHSQTEIFPFRSYAQYSYASRIVVVSFDVKKTNDILHISGDVSREDGLVLKDIMQTTSILNSKGEAEMILACIRKFVLKCENESMLIENELRSLESM
jgi:hypothetical protein